MSVVLKHTRQPSAASTVDSTQSACDVSKGATAGFLSPTPSGRKQARGSPTSVSNSKPRGTPSLRGTVCGSLDAAFAAVATEEGNGKENIVTLSQFQPVTPGKKSKRAIQPSPKSNVSVTTIPGYAGETESSKSRVQETLQERERRLQQQQFGLSSTTNRLTNAQLQYDVKMWEDAENARTAAVARLDSVQKEISQLAELHAESLKRKIELENELQKERTAATEESCTPEEYTAREQKIMELELALNSATLKLKEHESLEEEVRRLRTEIATHEGLMESANPHHVITERTLEKQQKQWSARHCSEMNDVRAECQKIIAEKDAGIELREQSIRELRKAQERLEKAISELTAELQLKHSELETANGNVTASDLQLAIKDSRIQAAEQKVSDLSVHLQSEINTKQVELDSVRQELETHQQDIDKLRAEVIDLQTQITEQQVANRVWEERAVAAEAQIGELQAAAAVAAETIAIASAAAAAAAATTVESSAAEAVPSITSADLIDGVLSTLQPDQRSDIPSSVESMADVAIAIGLKRAREVMEPTGELAPPRQSPSKMQRRSYGDADPRMNRTTPMKAPQTSQNNVMFFQPVASSASSSASFEATHGHVRNVPGGGQLEMYVTSSVQMDVKINGQRVRLPTVVTEQIQSEVSFRSVEEGIKAMVNQFKQ